MQYTVYRLTSFFFLLVTFVLLSHELFFDLYVSVLFCHYILAVTYSGGQLKKLNGSKRYYIPLVILIILGVVITQWTYPAIGVYFGIHYALSETYMVLKGVHAPNPYSFSKIIATRFLFGLFSYLVILRYQLDFVDLYIEYFFGLALLFFVASFICVLINKDMSGENKKNLIIFELVGLVIMLVLFFYSVDVPFYVLVFYHITMWLIFPAHSLPRNKSNRYLLYNGVLITLFFILTPSVELHDLVPSLSRDSWMGLSILFGYVHITISFALSAMNPEYIRRWFYA
jgi:hypothetical protein